MSTTEEKEKELLRLIQVKAEKVANNFLTRERHTQLSYLSEPERKRYIDAPKSIILDKLIALLERF